MSGTSRQLYDYNGYRWIVYHQADGEWSAKPEYEKWKCFIHNSDYMSLIGEIWTATDKYIDRLNQKKEGILSSKELEEGENP